MSRSAPESEHHEFVTAVNILSTRILRGRYVHDRVFAEHMLRVLEATSEVLADHRVDSMGRCTACRQRTNALLSRRRTPCAIHDAFSYYLKGHRRH